MCGAQALLAGTVALLAWVCASGREPGQQAGVVVLVPVAWNSHTVLVLSCIKRSARRSARRHGQGQTHKQMQDSCVWLRGLIALWQGMLRLSQAGMLQIALNAIHAWM